MEHLSYVNNYLVTVSPFAIVLLLAECKVQKVFNVLGFLSHTFGKGMYLTFMGSVCVDGMGVGSVVGIVIICMGVFLMCCQNRVGGQAQDTKEEVIQ